ncbi:unnamed protein product [Rotaria magnacalcarata]|uniref:HAT C-terminal dimerisation domain-containing protein n=1 Tax=Rotaria magnacalcarata TaxID=392030 RepID=A0A819W151_9BILA|nr:unnamed protein product [Rotaria magnacalcarata]
MPHHTKFSHNWLNRTDTEGRNVNTWLKQGDSISTFKCTLCKTCDLDCSNQGWAAIVQHMKTKLHLENMPSLKNNSIISIESLKQPTSSTDGVISIPQLKLGNTKRPITFDFQEQVTKAEAVWALTVAQRGYSFNSRDEIGDVFRHMFPDSKIAQEFSMQSRKTSYVLSHGLGSYFHQELVKCLKRSVKFVLCFDEQTNNQDRHATAAILKTAIIDSLKADGLELNQLLMLGRDSPFINLSLENMIDNEMKKIGSGLLKLGGCHLHVAHNGFKAGLFSSDWNIQNKYTIDDYNCVMEKTMLYFANTRWVLLGKVITRVFILWEPLHEYFLVYLPVNQKVQVQNNDRYERIKETLTSYVIKIRLQFVLFLCENIFDRFLTLFQQEAPLIHVLHSELSSLYRLVLLQFLKTDYAGDKVGGCLLDLDFKLNEKQLNNKHIRIGEETRKLLNHLTQQEREKVFEDVKKIYHTTAEYLKKNLPLKNSFLSDVQILHPSYRSVEYSDKIVRIARAVPGLLSEREIDYSRDEWLIYSLDNNIDEKWYIKKKKKDCSGTELIIYHRIDYYWNKVLNIKTANGFAKYPTLSKLIKNILIIPHGNADVERGFSINENLVPENRSKLSCLSINGLRSTYDGVKFIGNGSSHKVPINREIIKSIKMSYSLYKKDIQSKKKVSENSEKENIERQQAVEMCKQALQEEDELLLKQKTLQSELHEATSIIADASARLQLAIKQKDNLEIHRSTILIDGGNTKSKAVNEQLSKVTENLIQIQRKRKNSFGQQQQKRQKTLTEESIILN